MSFRKLSLLAAALALPACEEDVNDDSTSPAVTLRVSTGVGGLEADRACQNPDLTPDGRYAVFETAAALVPGDLNGRIDIYRKDLATGAIVLVSVNDLGDPGDGDSTRPSISADGSRVAFQSLSTNLSATDADPTSDVYVRDLTAGTTTHVSQAEGGGPSTPDDDGSFAPAISGDGLWVAFVSDAADLVSVPPNIVPENQIFRVELASGAAEMLTVTTLGDAAEAPSDRPSLSFDGSEAAFESFEDDLVAGDANGAADVFVWSGGTLELLGGNGNSAEARISPDGRFVAFSSEASDLAPGDVNGVADVFVHDRQGPTTTRASLGAGQSSSPAVSSDGRFVAFVSAAPNLVPGDTNGVSDHFLRDVAAGRTYRLSVRTGGAQASGESVGRPALSGDGRFALFASAAPDLVVGDANGGSDVFLRGPNY